MISIKSNEIIFYRMLRRTNSQGKSVNAPSVVHRYNETVGGGGWGGGVDLGDQSIGQCEPPFRSLKFRKMILFSFLMNR